MMNGDGESCNDTIAHLPTDLESTQGFVSAAAEEEAPSASPTPSDQTSAHEVLKEQIGDDSVIIANEEAAAESEVVVDPEDKLPGDISLQSVAADVSEEEANGQGEVESEKVEISDMWNNGLPNGNTTGWASAEAPGGESSGVAAEGSSASSSGVLGSAPGPAGPTAEQPVQQRYTYYMIRIPRPVDDKGKADINKAEMKLQAKADERDQHNMHVQEAKRKRNEAFEKRQSAREVERQSLKKLKAKFEELKPLRDGMKKLKDASMRDRNQGAPRSEEELDSRIGALEWRIQHESIPLKEEKQLMRDIKALESSRESVRQTAARNVQVQESVGTREEIEEALKPLNAEYKQLEVEFKAASVKLKAAEEEYEKLNEALTGVMGHLHKANDVRQEAYEARRLLKQQEYGRLKEFYDNKREIQQAKDMASQPKSRQAVEEFCNAQVERVMELWIQNDEFRKTYVKDNERSTVRRLETLDGRALGPDEKPLKLSFYENPVPSSVPERSQSKPSATENGHGGMGGGEAEEAVEKKEKLAVTKESKKESKEASKEASKVFPADSDVAIAVVQKSAEEVEREAAELKEKRRAAEMAKAKEAEERKKRIAERAQVKAQAWAQKEAERKEKEREKRARKKAAPVSSAEAPVELEASPVVESSESGPEVEEAVVEVKKVSSKQRRRGMTSSQKAVEKIPLPPVRRGRKKMFGLSVVSLVGMSAVAVILVAIAIFMLYSGNSGRRAQSQRGK